MVSVIGVPLKECLHLCHQLLDWGTEHFRTVAGVLYFLPITTPLTESLYPTSCRTPDKLPSLADSSLWEKNTCHSVRIPFLKCVCSAWQKPVVQYSSHSHGSTSSRNSSGSNSRTSLDR